jgi:hypothetical protein
VVAALSHGVAAGEREARQQVFTLSSSQQSNLASLVQVGERTFPTETLELWMRSPVSARVAS